MRAIRVLLLSTTPSPKRVCTICRAEFKRVLGRSDFANALITRELIRPGSGHHSSRI